MKKFFFFLFLIGIFTIPALADYQVDAIEVTAEVQDTGRAQVTATVQLTFDSITDTVTIPLPERRVSDVSVGDFRFSTGSGKTGASLTVSRTGGFAGTQTFVVRYTVPYRDSGGSESDRFTLGLLSSQWEKAIPSVRFQVLMPAPFDVQPEVSSGYYGLLSPSETRLAVTDSGFGGSLSDRMAYDTLAVSLDLPEGYFAVRRTTVPGISITYLALIMLALFILAVVYWRLKLRSPKAAVSPRLLMPEGLTVCQLPTALDGATCDIPAMVLEWANLGYLVISQSARGATILIRRMQMGSERSRAEQYLFSRIFARGSRVAVTPGAFSAPARKFRAAMRRPLYRVMLDRKGGNPAIVQLLCRLLLAVSIGYLAGNLLPEGGGFLVLAVLAGIAGFLYSMYLHSRTAAFAALGEFSPLTLILWLLAAALLALSLIAGALPEYVIGLTACLFSAIATASGPRRSARGAEITAQAKGCRTFYRHASWQRLQLYQDKSSRFFQRQLPRAVALGAEKRFARRFERLPVPMPEWLWLPETPSRSAEDLRRQLAPILKQLREAFR